MTREEAYNRIDAIIARHEIDDDYVTITSMLDYDALRLARKLLEQEPCSDAVSRQAVLEYIEGSGAELGHDSENELVCQDIKELPPVIPQPKTGHWITTPREPQPFDGIDFGDEEKTYYIACSECGYQFTSTSKMTNYKFCPKCGARMESKG